MCACPHGVTSETHLANSGQGSRVDSSGSVANASTTEPGYFELRHHTPDTPTTPGVSNHAWTSLLPSSELPAAKTPSQFSTPPFPLPTTLLPPRVTPRLLSPTSSQVAARTADMKQYMSLDPGMLLELLHKRPILQHPEPEHILILDIRPTTAFVRAHLRNSTNVCAPTTLLRRSEFTIERLEEQILDVGPEKETFEQWRSYTDAPSQTSWIVALDTDSTKPTSIGRSSAGGGGPSLLGLLRKFDVAGYKGTLCWVRGGFHAIMALAESSQFIEHDTTNDPKSSSYIPHAMRHRGLTLDAFRRASTVDAGLGGTDRLQAVNPFFDNIRQNMELSCGITDIVPLDLDLDDAQLERMPRFVRDLAKMESSDRARHLAELFFSIEKSEQQRLQNIMQRHSQESSSVHSNAPLAPVNVSQSALFPLQRSVHELPKDAFPLSITAALERGHDHRYRNFWPFEHSRVKFEKPTKDAEYINASYVNPLRAWGDHHVYIATQAPMPSTFCAFWRVVWEHKSPAIIMVARERESGRLQCDDYWSPTHIGPFSMRIISERTISQAELDSDGAQADSIPQRQAPVVLRRMIELHHTQHPDEPAHTVRQYQFLAWPDHSVPEKPDSLLGLMRLVHTETASNSDAPTIVHCSAGIGRTGTHILVDSVSTFLHRVRHLVERQATSPEVKYWHSPNDLIFEALMVMREQRMSTVETVRQYVFAYKAVIASLLHSSVP